MYTYIHTYVYAYLSYNVINLLKVKIRFIIAETATNFLLLWQKIYSTERNTFALDTAFTT